MLIYTVGYGNRAIGDFIDLLKHYQVGCLVDTRSIPYSRFRPAYRKTALQRSLEQAEIVYLYLGEALGGKKVDPDCIVDGKVDLALLAGNPAFKVAVDQVEQAVREGKILALMCAEQRPESCHRSWMLAPQMQARGIEVRHIDEHGALKTQEEVQGWFGNA